MTTMEIKSQVHTKFETFELSLPKDQRSSANVVFKRDKTNPIMWCATVSAARGSAAGYGASPEEALADAIETWKSN